MRFKLYRENGAQNSGPIFDAFEQSVIDLGHDIVKDGEDIPVIWSVLWAGRMERNRIIYHQARKHNKPIIIIEVGNLKRNITWRVSLNHINNLGEFANFENLDSDRPQKLGIFLEPEKHDRKPEILIATQHQQSLQWEGMIPMAGWVENKIKEIRKHTDRKIIVRHHPRSPLVINDRSVITETPKKILNSYDDYNIDYNYHCIINHNSGPGVQAAIQGVPVMCDQSSLAYSVSDFVSNIENPRLLNREEWFLKLCHTEWTVDEIRQGLPLSRLLTKIC
jgi:hypothetical protein